MDISQIGPGFLQSAQLQSSSALINPIDFTDSFPALLQSLQSVNTGTVGQIGNTDGLAMLQSLTGASGPGFNDPFLQTTDSFNEINDSDPYFQATDSSDETDGNDPYFQTTDSVDDMEECDPYLQQADSVNGTD